ncbi:MAG: hypothetical protein KJ574_05140 [Nanoarchaeota archaeon]|nr:hypothetical protein [Nanoarchaeota archaeon]
MDKKEFTRLRRVVHATKNNLALITHKWTETVGALYDTDISPSILPENAHRENRFSRVTEALLVAMSTTRFELEEMLESMKSPSSCPPPESVDAVCKEARTYFLTNRSALSTYLGLVNDFPDFMMQEANFPWKILSPEYKKDSVSYVNDAQTRLRKK